MTTHVELPTLMITVLPALQEVETLMIKAPATVSPAPWVMAITRSCPYILVVKTCDLWVSFGDGAGSKWLPVQKV